jgi:hypothetical protein
MRRSDLPRSRFTELDKEETRLDKIAMAARQQVIEELLYEGEISLLDDGDGFASGGRGLSDKDKTEIIAVANAMGNRYTNSVVGQYNRDGDLSDAQWDALDRMTKRFDKASGEYVRNTRLVEKRNAARGNTGDGLASIYPKDELGLEQFINQQELELEDYEIMSKLEPDKYPLSGLESTRKRIATAKRDLARIQKNKPQPVEEEEEFLASIDGFASNPTRERSRAGIQNVKRELYADLSDEEYDELLDVLQGTENQNLGREIVPMDDGTGKMVPTEVFWGSRPNSEGVSAADDWAWDFAPKGEWMEIGVGESSNVSRVWVKPNSDNSYFGNEAMVMFGNGKVYKYDDVIRPNLIKLLKAEDESGAEGSMGKSVRLITQQDGEKAPFTVVGELSDALAIVKGDGADYPDGYEADMADMATQDVASNFNRLSQDDQNKYFQRALTNNADSGMTTDQILDEARKLAMDDRQMAILERQAIGMGGSSKPRKLDVSSSSALNSVSYDEMNESLQVEYRGRDGQGTGTLYTYEGVTPDVVDRIEAADSRGATMREIRDNFEFTTSRKLPDSAYEGLASRGGRKSTEDYKDLVDSLPDPTERPNKNRYMQAADGARNVVEDRYALIHARRRIAKEMAEANGVEWKDGISVYDVTDDDDDLEILMDLDSRIDELNEYVTANDKEYRRVRGLEQAVYRQSSELSDIKRSIELALDNYEGTASDIEEYSGDNAVDWFTTTPEENAKELADRLRRELADLADHRDENNYRDLAREYSEDLAEAKTLIESGTPEDLKKAVEVLTGAADKQISDYDDDARRLDYEGDELLDSGYRAVELRDEEYDYNSDGDDNWDYSDDIDGEDGRFNVIADELYGPEPTDSDVVNEYMGVSDGLASRGNRRRPGRRNQGGRGQRMAPKTSYTDEERQNLADRNILKSRTRPGKRRTGPSADEFDGFASRTNPDDVAELPTDERVVFEGGEHGPGKEISLNQMWRNYLKSIPSSTPGGRKQPDKWASTEPGVGATFAEFMERFGPNSPVGLDAESVRQLMNARTPGKKEVFIDDTALAENLARALSKEPTSLFGFDPLAYYDDDGKKINITSMLDENLDISDEQLDAITEQERARRVARMAARGNRLGKRDVIQRRPTSSSGASSEPVGEMSLEEFEAKLQKTFGQSVRLTDDDGNALPAERMKANIEKSGIPFPFTSIEPFRQMQKRQILPYEYAKELVKMGVLDPSDLPARASSSLGEFSQWPGFAKANVKMPAVVQALAEVGIDIGEKNRRSIQQGLSDAKKGALRKINTGKLRADSVLIPMAKLTEMVERLGLDADEFAKWFGSTFTPSADKN